jgi:hypothetical protein
MSFGHRLRVARVAALGIVALFIVIGTPALAQQQAPASSASAGGACAGSNFLWPDANGHILQCVSSVWTLVSEPDGIWTQSGSTAYYTGGRVGIGTTSPIGTLNALDAGTHYNDDVGIIQASQDAHQRIIIGYDTSLGSYGSGFIQSLQDNAGYSNTIINARGGNVGIGVASPNAQLEVQKDLTTSPNLRGSSVDASGDPAIELFQTTAAAYNWRSMAAAIFNLTIPPLHSPAVLASQYLRPRRNWDGGAITGIRRERRRRAGREQ